MSGTVVDFTGVTRLNADPDRVIRSAIGECDRVVILGYTKDGGEYFASSVADGGTIIWLLERLKKKLLEAPEILGAE